METMTDRLEPIDQAIERDGFAYTRAPEMRAVLADPEKYRTEILLTEVRPPRHKDGRPDLITANQFSADLSVLLGKGDGSFQNQRRFGAGFRECFNVGR